MCNTIPQWQTEEKMTHIHFLNFNDSSPSTYIYIYIYIITIQNWCIFILWNTIVVTASFDIYIYISYYQWLYVYLWYTFCMCLWSRPSQLMQYWSAGFIPRLNWVYTTTTSIRTAKSTMIPHGHSAEMYVYVCVNVPVVESVHITY